MLVDLKLTKKDMAEEASPEQNPYPYGVCLNLDTDELAKLGITSANLPEVGDEYHVVAVGKVTRVSENETEGSDYSCGLGIQITAMELTPESQGGSDDDEAGESAVRAESQVTGGKSVVHSAYRGRK